MSRIIIPTLRADRMVRPERDPDRGEVRRILKPDPLPWPGASGLMTCLVLSITYEVGRRRGSCLDGVGGCAWSSREVLATPVRGKMGFQARTESRTEVEKWRDLVSVSSFRPSFLFCAADRQGMCATRDRDRKTRKRGGESSFDGCTFLFKTKLDVKQRGVKLSERLLKII